MEVPRVGGPVTASGNTGAGGSYSRRRLPGDANTTDRHRLLADRNAYISYLEAQADNASEAAMELEALGGSLRQIRSRVEELEEKVDSTARIVELVQESSTRAGEGARAGQQEVEDQMRLMHGRVQLLENLVGEARLTAEAEMSRLRNEMALVVQDMGQRLETRIESLKTFTDEGVSSVIHEAQATCVRLADDALSAAEASQRKVDEFARRTEASLEVLRVDINGIRAEVASSGRNRAAWHTTPPATEPAAYNGSTYTLGKEVVSCVDALEKRLAARLGNQVLQLSEVLRRVVQAQAALHRHVALPPGALSYPVSEPSGVPGDLGVDAGHGKCSTVNNSISDVRQRAAIDDLYRELRHLEEGATASKNPCRAARANARG